MHQNCWMASQHFKVSVMCFAQARVFQYPSLMKVNSSTHTSPLSTHAIYVPKTSINSLRPYANSFLVDFLVSHSICFSINQVTWGTQINQYVAEIHSTGLKRKPSGFALASNDKCIFILSFSCSLCYMKRFLTSYLTALLLGRRSWFSSSDFLVAHCKMFTNPTFVTSPISPWAACIFCNYNIWPWLTCLGFL